MIQGGDFTSGDGKYSGLQSLHDAQFTISRYWGKVHIWREVSRRKLQVEAQQERNFEHGQFRKRHQWVPILHHYRSYTVSLMYIFR